MPSQSVTAIAVLVCAAATFAVTAGSDDAPSTPRSVLLQREWPHDPPGIAARPVPGAPAAQPIVVGNATTYQVNVDAAGANIPGDAANEPSIAIDPTNPNRMAIGWRQFDTIASSFRQAGWAYSQDGGQTWTFPGVIEPGVFRSDPVLAYDAEGNFYYNSLKVIGGVFSCQVFKSTDGGQTWGPPAEAFGGDKQWMTIDRTGGPGHGHIYQAWNTAAGCCEDTTFNRSLDGGATFEYPVPIPSTPIFGTLDVDADGNLLLVGVDPSNLGRFFVSKSTNAKDSLATPTFTTELVFMNGEMKIGSGGGGPNPVGLMGQAWLAVDRSGGPNDGNVYVLCSVDPPDDDLLDIHFIRSTDGGQTWSFPVVINDDDPTARNWQWFATMSVAPNGRIDVVWNDTRDAGTATVSALYYSFSVNGGVTWSANQRISPTFNSQLGWPQQEKLGDYYDMVSENDVVHIAWAATFNQEQDVYYTRISDPLTPAVVQAYESRWADGRVEVTWRLLDAVADVAFAIERNEGHGVYAPVAGAEVIRRGEDYAYHDFDTQPGTDYRYRVKITEEGVVTASFETSITTPATGLTLYQNRPNPFNPSTRISYSIDRDARVRLAVYDVGGRLVRTLADEPMPAGTHVADWDGRDDEGRAVASGVYFYRLQAGKRTLTRKALLIK
jgi:hypothetical protein